MANHHTQTRAASLLGSAAGSCVAAGVAGNLRPHAQQLWRGALVDPCARTSSGSAGVLRTFSHAAKSRPGCWAGGAAIRSPLPDRIRFRDQAPFDLGPLKMPVGWLPNNRRPGRASGSAPTVSGRLRWQQEGRPQPVRPRFWKNYTVSGRVSGSQRFQPSACPANRKAPKVHSKPVGGRRDALSLEPSASVDGPGAKHQQPRRAARRLPNGRGRPRWQAGKSVIEIDGLGRSTSDDGPARLRSENMIRRNHMPDAIGSDG